MLDDAWDSAQRLPDSLRNQLRVNETAARKLISAGSLASVAKNSTSQSWMTGSNALTPLQVQRAWRMLINLFDQKFAKISVALTEIPVPTWCPTNTSDASVYGLMAFTLQPIYEYATDFTELLLPPTIAPPTPMSI